MTKVKESIRTPRPVRTLSDRCRSRDVLGVSGSSAERAGGGAGGTERGGGRSADVRGGDEVQLSAQYGCSAGRPGRGAWTGRAWASGVQYAAKMGFRTVAIARGADKACSRRRWARAAYIDSQAQDPSAELQRLGGAKVVLATVTNADAMTAVMGGLGVKGVFMIVGAVPKLEVPSLQMLLRSQEVRGWYSGTAADSEDGLNFSLLEEVRSIDEIYKLEQFKEGYERMMSGKARFRVVMTME
jgi:hypothetical protein